MKWNLPSDKGNENEKKLLKIDHASHSAQKLKLSDDLKLAISWAASLKSSSQTILPINSIISVS